MSEEKQEFEINVIGWHAVFCDGEARAVIRDKVDAECLADFYWSDDKQIAEIKRKDPFPDDLKNDVEKFLRELRENFDYAPFLDALLERF